MKHNGAGVLVGYVLFMFVAMGIAPFLHATLAEIYLSVAIFAMGGAAVVCQKWFHRESFLDMGFRLNRNAVLGVLVALIFTGVQLAGMFWAPVALGWVRVAPNPEIQAQMGDLPLWIASIIVMVGGGAILFPAALFGEELAFRGYVLPRLQRHMGTIVAIGVNAAIFGLWHFPAYYSLYRGGAAEQGVGSVLLMLLQHGVSVVPVCILYVTTRELYGVSLYHALIDIFQYGVVGAPELGDAAKDALYKTDMVQQTACDVLGWVGLVAGIVIMMGLCWVIKRWVRPIESRIQPPMNTDSHR